MTWRMILPAQPVPWVSGMWSLLDGPSHFLSENESGERYYVHKDRLTKYTGEQSDEH